MAHYDSFISYSHSADGKLAPAIQAGLQRLAKPWSRRRALEVFRDETGLAVSPDLWGSITEAMDASSWFVLLASPEAAQSKWVDQEIERWLGRGPEFRNRILPVLTAGTLDWDDERNTFSSATDAAPPALYHAFDSEPLYVDLSWARDDQQLDLDNARFRQSIAHLAAPMHGVTQDELIGEDVRQHRRSVRIRRIAVASLAALTVGAVAASFFAIQNARQADQSAAESRSRELAAVAENSMEEDPELAALLAVEALYPESSRTDQAVEAHRNTLNQLLTTDTYPTGQRIEADADVIAISPDATTLATVAEAGPLEFWDLVTGERDGEPVPLGIESPSDLAFSPDGRSVLVWAPAGVEVVDVGSRQATPIADASWAAAWRADGSIVYADGSQGRVMMRSDAGSPPVELGSVDARITALAPTVSGALVVGESTAGAGWVLPPGGGAVEPLPTQDRDPSDGFPANAVWVADPREDVVHRYWLEVHGSLADGSGVFPSYSVVRLPLSADQTSTYLDQHGSFAVAAGTLVVSDDGSFMAAVDGELDQGLPDAIIGIPDRGHSVHVWHPASGGTAFSIPTNEARDVAWVPGERTLAIASRRGVEFVRVRADPVVSDVWALDVSDDGSRMVTSDGGYTTAIVVHDSSTGVIARYDGGPSAEGEGDEGPYDRAVSLRPDGRVAVFERNGTLEAVDLDTGMARPAAAVADDVILSSPLFSPDGSRLKLGFTRWVEPTWESGWLLADGETGAVIVEETDEDERSASVLAWSADGASLYLSVSDSSSPSPVLHDYVIETGESTPISAIDAPSAFAATDDGSTVAVGSDDGDVAIVDVQEGEVTRALPLHPAAVTSLDFSADGGRLLSVGRTVVMTSVEDGEEIWSSNGVPALANGERWTLAEFSPDGRSIPLGGGYVPFHVLVDFDPALACASVSERAFERLAEITDQESACRRVAELRDAGTEARPLGAVDLPPIVTVPYEFPAGVDPLPAPSDIAADGQPVVVVDPTIGLPEVTVPTFDATCTTFVDNDQLPVRQDQRGVTVARVQSALRSLGYELDADGCFGPRTTAVVREFQTSAGLEVDGLVGPATVDALVVEIQT